ncbi:hypothetical protein V502_00922, partial [Pseudogymnoascus sp. VKM F-4520 (FW-2644)]
QMLSSYKLKTVEQLNDQTPQLKDKCMPIEGLACYNGFCCLHAQCSYCTQHLPKMKEHVSSTHKVKAAEHKTSPLWRECTLQTYFVGRGRVKYFVVVDNKKLGKLNTSELSTALKEEEKELFIKLEDDYQDVKGDIEKQAGIVQDFGDSQSAWVPWLERCSYKLLPKKEVDGGAEGATDPDLVCILAAAEAMLRDAYKLCSNTLPDWKMTQQQANILNEFYTGASGKADGFQHFKNPSTLVTYFTTMKQLLVYYYCVVHFEGSHFTQAKPDQVLPRDVIQPTKTQTQAMDEIMAALTVEDAEEAKLALKHAIR